MMVSSVCFVGAPQVAVEGGSFPMFVIARGFGAVAIHAFFWMASSLKRLAMTKFSPLWIAPRFCCSATISRSIRYNPPIHL
jgi:hypothetical protein